MIIATILDPSTARGNEPNANFRRESLTVNKGFSPSAWCCGSLDFCACAIRSTSINDKEQVGWDLIRHVHFYLHC